MARRTARRTPRTPPPPSATAGPAARIDKTAPAFHRTRASSALDERARVLRELLRALAVVGEGGQRERDVDPAAAGGSPVHGREPALEVREAIDRDARP